MCFSVLIVDDEKMPREILHHYIPWEEYGVRSVYEAQEKARWSWPLKKSRILS